MNRLYIADCPAPGLAPFEELIISAELARVQFDETLDDIAAFADNQKLQAHIKLVVFTVISQVLRGILLKVACED